MNHSSRAENSFSGTLKPSWCKGCSFFIFQKVLNETLQILKYDPLHTVIVSGIGCSSRSSLSTAAYGMHTLHGRAIPVATGIRLSRPDLPVIVIGGDGDLFSIGTGHFVHAARNNINIKVICLNNMMYAMTKNQSSPTTAIGQTGSFTPEGIQSAPLNLVEFAISCKASFVARTTTFSPDHLAKTINNALKHNGFSFIDIVSPCRTYSPKYFSKENKVSIVDINNASPFDYKDYSQALWCASQNAFQTQGIEAVLPVGTFFEA
jgi:2-oxoglutarate ferredoxin oxidoreductase subunit beta